MDVSPVLSKYINCLWTTRREFCPPSNMFEILPDSYIELVFCFGSQVYITVAILSAAGDSTEI